MEKTQTKRQTTKELREQLEDTEKRLMQAVEDLHRTKQALTASEKRESEFKLAAHRANCQFDAVHLQLQKLAQHKGAVPELCQKVDQLTVQVHELEQHNKLLTNMRDENATYIMNLRDRVFALEHGIDDRVAKAEGQALFYRKKLIDLLKSLRNAIDEDSGLLGPSI